MRGSVAAVLPTFGGWVIEAANGDALALTEERDDIERWLQAADLYYDDALRCGHPSAGSWVGVRYPIRARIVTAEERDEILEDGTPVLQREP